MLEELTLPIAAVVVRRQAVTRAADKGFAAGADTITAVAAVLRTIGRGLTQAADAIATLVRIVRAVNRATPVVLARATDPISAVARSSAVIRAGIDILVGAAAPIATEAAVLRASGARFAVVTGAVSAHAAVGFA